MKSRESTCSAGQFFRTRHLERLFQAVTYFNLTKYFRRRRRPEAPSSRLPIGSLRSRPIFTGRASGLPGGPSTPTPPAPYNYGENGVRCVPDSSPGRVLADHLARYQWAADYIRRENIRGKPITVLDLAAGAGYGSRKISESADRVIGVEISRAGIIECRRTRNERIAFVQGDATLLPLRPGSCDLVVSFETVEHIPLALVSEYLREVHRVLRSGGRFLISTPNRRLTSPFQGRDNPTNPHHCFEWTKGEFTLAVKELFRVESTWGQRCRPRLLTALPVRKQLARLRHPAVPFHKQWSRWYQRLYSPERGCPLVVKGGIFRDPRYCILIAQRL